MCEKIVRVTLKTREFVSQRPESSMFLSKYIFYLLFERPVQNFESPIVSWIFAYDGILLPNMPSTLFPVIFSPIDKISLNT